jgi:hypothetical protein
VVPRAGDNGEKSVSTQRLPAPTGIWEKYLMALDEVTERLQRIARALEEAGIPYALVGGQAVALWVATRDPAAVRTTKDVDILLRREDLPRARAAAAAVALDYFEVVGVGMFLERSDPNPRKAVHLLWAGEKVRPEYPLPSGTALDPLQGLRDVGADAGVPVLPGRAERGSRVARRRSHLQERQHRLAAHPGVGILDGRGERRERGRVGGTDVAEHLHRLLALPRVRVPQRLDPVGHGLAARQRRRGRPATGRQ